MPKPNDLVPVVLRLGLAVVFVWFGSQQLANPAVWSAFVPALTTNPWISPSSLVLLNGWMELFGALLLMLGLWLRPVALILGLHLLLIAIEASGAIGVRDFGLAIACFALALALPDRWTLDYRFSSANQKPPHAQAQGGS